MLKRKGFDEPLYKKNDAIAKLGERKLINTFFPDIEIVSDLEKLTVGDVVEKNIITGEIFHVELERRDPRHFDANWRRDYLGGINIPLKHNIQNAPNGIYRIVSMADGENFTRFCTIDLQTICKYPKKPNPNIYSEDEFFYTVPYVKFEKWELDKESNIWVKGSWIDEWDEDF